MILFSAILSASLSLVGVELSNSQSLTPAQWSRCKQSLSLGVSKVVPLLAQFNEHYAPACISTRSSDRGEFDNY